MDLGLFLKALTISNLSIRSISFLALIGYLLPAATIPMPKFHGPRQQWSYLRRGLLLSKSWPNQFRGRFTDVCYTGIMIKLGGTDEWH